MKLSHPKILLLYKVSTYAYYFSSWQRHPEAPMPLRNLGRFKRTHLKHYRTLASVESFLKKQHVRYHRSQRGRRIDFSRYEVVITVGGDGTFLEAARSCRRQAILGINSDPKWSVGRFCLATDKTFPRILKKVIAKKYKILPLHRLQFQITGRPGKVNVLNDVLVCHANPAAMSRYLIRINRRKEEQRSSGVWISTAAGSTGAICSAGGKILPFFSNRWQYIPRELYRTYLHKCVLKGGGLSPQQKLSVTSLMSQGVAYIDGSHFKYVLPMGKEVILRKSSQPLRMIVP
jgi:NAD+ kinase